MAAVNLRRGRQLCELIERIQHLPGRAFEEPSATACKEGIAAEHDTRSDVCDMPCRMARDGKNRQLQSEFGKIHGVSFLQPMRECRNRFAPGTVHGNMKKIEEVSVAADVVAMVMGTNDRNQPQLFLCEIRQHWLGVARIDHDCVFAFAQQPDIIILKCL